MFELEPFADRVQFYAPREPEEFIGQLESLAGTKHTHKTGESNVPDYVTSFDRFLRTAIDRT